METRTVAVICEVNPLHAGHAYIFSRARALAGENGCVMAVMSGHFVQRGSCAVFDRYTRARTVLSAGADLVLELPFPWSASSAAYFAGAGAAIASSAGAEYLLFGSECGDTALLGLTAEALAGTGGSGGEKHAAAGEAVRRTRLLTEAAPDIPPEMLRNPNDILGVAYIDACQKTGMKPFAEKRIPALAPDGATALRGIMEAAGYRAVREMLPAYTAAVYDVIVENGHGPASEKRLSDALQRLLAVMGERLPVAAETGGGVRERLLRCAAEASGGQDFFARAATKKYTNARLRRAALFLALGVPAFLLREAPAYAFLLAANRKGRGQLAACRGRGAVPIVTKPADVARIGGNAAIQNQLSERADTLYGQCLPQPLPASFFARRGPVMTE